MVDSRFMIHLSPKKSREIFGHRWTFVFKKNQLSSRYFLDTLVIPPLNMESSMKRDFDLVRRILMKIQDTPAGEYCDEIAYPDEYDPATISEHVRLLIDENFLNGKMVDAWGSSPQFRITGLTWKGHDFVDAAKDNTLWEKAKKTILTTTAAITCDLLLLWLKTEIKMSLGLP